MSNTKTDVAKPAWYRAWLDVGVDNVGYTIVRLASIVAPIPALVALLEAHHYSIAAWFTVLAIEWIGYAIGEESVKGLRLRVLTIRQVATALSIYGLVVEGLMVAGIVAPAIADYRAEKIGVAVMIRASVALLYPLFTMAGAVLFAFHQYLKKVEADQDHLVETERERDDHTWRITAERDDLTWQDERANRLAMQALQLSVKEQKLLSKQTLPEVELSGKVSTESMDKAIVRFFKTQPGAKFDIAAAHVGCSVPLISKRVVALQALGYLHSKKEGTRKIVTVNGQHEEFLNG